MCGRTRLLMDNPGALFKEETWWYVQPYGKVEIWQ